MVFIPGSNNGTFGMGMSRGAMFPSSMGGPFGHRGMPLPINLQMPTGVMDRPYAGRAFGKGTVYQLTPGGVTTEAGWGFKNRSRSFGGQICGPFGYGRSRRHRRSRRRKTTSSVRRCVGKTKNGKRCKHKTHGKFCKCHKKQSRKRRRSRST